MPDPTPFDRIAEQLEQSTSLDRLESRGTLRIALKDAGFDARTVRVEDPEARKFLTKHRRDTRVERLESQAEFDP